MDLLIFLFFMAAGIVLCTATGWAAVNFGRDFWSYFFLSLLLSPVVGFVVLLSKGKDGKKCPSCAEIVKPEALVCRFCSYTFKEKVSDVAPSRPAADMWERSSVNSEKVTFEEFAGLQERFNSGEITEEEFKRKKEIYYRG